VKSPFVAAALAAFAISCGVSVPYASDYPLTQEIIRSPFDDFTGKVPRGWLISSGDSALPAITLFDSSLSSAIVIREVRLDSLSRKEVGSGGLELLVHIVAGLSGGSPADAGVKTFSIGKAEYCSAEWISQSGASRLVVFSTRGHHYACEARRTRSPGTPEQEKMLFSVQQSLLGSLSF
jgi:hypothetical protein